MARELPTPVLPRRALARTASVLALLAAALPAAGAQEPAAVPDQVYAQRRDEVVVLQGEVTQDALEGLVLSSGGKDTKVPASEVVRVVWGEVPPAFRDGQVFFDRGEYDDAVAKLRVAAGDASARPLVQAAARLQAAEALLRWGGSEPARFAEAGDEARKFLDAHGQNRGAPRARMLEARARWLAGDPARAAELYRAVYAELSAGAPPAGYRVETVLRAGVEAGDALLAAGSHDAAKTLYAEVERAIADQITRLDGNAGPRAELQGLQAQALLGEGHCLLAGGDARAAETFFQGKLSGSPASADLRFGGELGLAEALFAQQRWRDAQLAFARVSALDFADRDRVARSQVRLAECALKLGDSEARTRARGWLTTVVAEHGDTPWAAQARDILSTL